MQSYVVTTYIDFQAQKVDPEGTFLPSGRIFHLNADVIKTCFEVLRVIFSLLIKHGELHPQLIVFYLPHLLQRERWDTGGGMKRQAGE